MILSIDVGTTSLKLGVYDLQLRLLASSERSYPLDTPDPSTVQIDPELWWKAFVQALKRIDYPLSRVEILTLSVNSPGFTIMDREGYPLMPSFLHLDRRAYPQSKKILKILGEELLLKVTGNIPNPGASTAANILWIKEHHPEVHNKTYMYGHTNTFFAKRLTGSFAVDPSNICMSNLFNTIKAEGYEPEIAAELGIELGKLPPVIQSYDRVGTLRKEVAAQTSLTQGIPVVMGANDATCAALSADIVHNGEIINITGTTEMVVVCMDKPLPSPRYNLKNHALKGLWNSMFALNTGGKAIEWAYREFFRDLSKEEFYSTLIPRLVREDRRDLPRFLPYLTGDRYSLVSKKASLTRLTLSTTREDILLAVIFGIVSKVGEYLEEVGKKLPLNSLVNLTGGGAGVLLHAKKKLLKGYRFKMVESGSMLGAAKLAAKYLKILPDFSEANDISKLNKSNR